MTDTAFDTSFDAEVTAKAAESGANASARFRERMTGAGGRSAMVDTARVNYLASKVIKGINDIVLRTRSATPSTTRSKHG